jgi:hypothetical protein
MCVKKTRADLLPLVLAVFRVIDASLRSEFVNSGGGIDFARSRMSAENKTSNARFSFGVCAFGWGLNLLRFILLCGGFT